MLSNLTKLHGVNHFAAPASAKVTGRTIPYFIECVEVLTGGKVFFEVDGVEREFERGTVFWHLSGENTIWKTVREAPYSCAVFVFEVREKKRLAPRVSHWTNSEDAAEFSEKCLQLFHAGIDDINIFSAYTYSTLLWNAKRLDATRPYPAPLRAAMKFIRNNCCDEIDAMDIATNSHVSKPYLFALFREHLKTSPHQYMLNHRINKAKLMLANGSEAIKEIAAQCGFGSLEVFYRQFKNQVKITPAEYRNRFMPYNFEE